MPGLWTLEGRRLGLWETRVGRDRDSSLRPDLRDRTLPDPVPPPFLFVDKLCPCSKEQIESEVRKFQKKARQLNKTK